MLVDTHAHLWWDSYKGDLEEVLARARKAGVEKIICPGTNVTTSRQAIGLAKKYPGMIYAAAGVHPEELQSSDHSGASLPAGRQGSELGKLIAENREQVVAVGEIGIDLNTEELREKLPEQRELFRAQCELAMNNNLPVIIHTRQSLRETFEVLDQLPKIPRGVFHCFSHDEEGVKEVLSRGFYISFGGNITWSKRVARLVEMIPRERLLLETDSPLLVPRDQKGVPIGGSERNEPANVRILAQIIAERRDVDLAELARQTTNNAEQLFGIS